MRDVKVEANDAVNSIELSNNAIGRDLVCKNNSPAPTGGGNSVGGEVKGCDDLVVAGE